MKTFSAVRRNRDKEVVSPGPGRPRAYRSGPELQLKVDQYFRKCDRRVRVVNNSKGKPASIMGPEPYSVTGLALFLGMDRARLLEYSKHDEFCYTIKMAKQRIEADLERRLLEDRNQTGAIFALKVNYGWKEHSLKKLSHETNKVVVYRPDKDR
jgi:DNA-packaging protein gp3